MHDITIVKLEPKHLAQTEKWASSQNATKILLKKPVTSVSPTSDMFGWTALKGDEVLAVAVIKLNKEHVGYLESRVKPSERRHGIGSRLIEYVLEQPAVDNLAHLHAAVEMSNIPAQKVLEANDFSRTGYTQDGRMELARHIRKD